MNIATLSTTIGLIATLSGGGWWAAHTFAEKSEVVALSSKTEYLLQQQIESAKAKQRLYLDRFKRSRDPADKAEADYWRDEVIRLEKVKAK